jgi:hypothetical protein
MILTYTKDFSWEIDPNLPIFNRRISKLLNFYDKFQYVAKNIKGFFFPIFIFNM